ncbi:hypothetical protein GMST_17530 [Geomonas silvestris]|uniref:Lipoprotein n=1 Tax=Geomonas silvestris TaxID=2740184 RepID=A0A6V8MHG1_9BACT|nr:hypothetical protein [Geomonas silvestris]GFO59428.1 hypothetical protein GMST_17530 [Geomonas silvestris]
MRLLTVLAAVWLGGALAGCATKTINLPPSQEMPAAEGEARLSRDDNGNTVVQLKVKHFAPPQRLTPPKAVYVVWLETSDHEMHNLGQLKVDKDLEGKLIAVTPYEVFQLVISAEDSPNLSEPGDQVVLRTRAVAP